MRGGELSTPVQLLAISTISGESKCACWASADSHFSMITNRPATVAERGQVDVAASRVTSTHDHIFR